MPNTSNKAYYLLNGLIEEGLSFIAGQMCRKIRYPVLFTDVIGRIHYPDEPGTHSQLDILFADLPDQAKENEHFYDQANQKLYVGIGSNRGRSYMIITDIPETAVELTLTSIEPEIKLAIKHYFYNMEKLRESQASFKQELVDYLFFKSNANIRDLIKMAPYELEIDKPYLVSIMEADDDNSKVDWQILSSYTTQHLKRVDLEIIPVSWTDGLIAIFPASFKKDTLEIDCEWTREIVQNSFKFKSIISRIFNQDISISLGQTYTLINLHKSYNEARLAMTLSKLLGRKNFVQQFSEMGLFTQLFSRDIDSLKIYVNTALGKLVEYDQNNNTDLLLTLTQLLDNNMNWKYTADNMHTHVNTLYYRVNKINKLLDIDLSCTESRVNLFTAIKVRDTLKSNGFLD